MCELEGVSSFSLTRDLLVKYRVFIKDLTPKIADGRQYIRLAVRDTQDNDRLISFLKEFAK